MNALPIYSRIQSVIWNQVLQLRTPLDDLDAREPILSQRLRDNSTQLEYSISRKAISTVNNVSQIGVDRLEHSIENPAECGHCLAGERKHLLAEIRKRPGFERFLLPKRISELTPA